MSDGHTKAQANVIEFDFDVDEPPHKVWRAISVPAYRQHWLPHDALTEQEPITITPGQEVRYRLRDDAPPFLESTVTFTVAPNENGGTCLRIIHELTDARIDRMARNTANCNAPPLKSAA